MASILQHHPLSNESSENDQMMPPHPDQTDTIDGESFAIYQPASTLTCHPALYPALTSL